MLNSKADLQRWSLFLLLLGGSGNTVAEAFYLDELVVTGTRTERQLLDTPVRTEVVTAKELERTHARSMKEALENVPGVQLREVHGKPGYEVWLQGVEADRVLVLIDGMPMTATTGSSVDVSQLAVLDIERVEVVKGAVSAQYGSAGIGGVVNIITRPPESGFSGHFTADAGSYGDQNPSGSDADPARYSARASVQGGNEQLALRLSASHQHSDGIDPQPETWARPGDEYDRTDLSFRTDWFPNSNHRLSAAVARFEEESGSRFTERNPPFVINQGKDETVTRIRYTLAGDHGRNSDLRAGWAAVHETLNDDTLKYTASSVFDDRRAESTLSRFSAHLGKPVGLGHHLQAGVDVNRETLKQTKDGASELGAEPRRERESQEVWVQDTWMPTAKLELVPGVRFQNDSDFGTHTAPKINARYDLIRTDSLTGFLRGGVGAGYRVPNLKERHFTFDHSQLGYIVQGTPDLEPEQSVSYQFGGGLSWNRSAWLEANAFLNDIEQLIQTSPDAGATEARNDGVQVFSYENLAEARTWGFETTAGWEPSEHWRLTAGYTLTRTEDVATGDELNRRPRHQARLGLDGPLWLPGLSWSARLRYQSEEFVNAASGTESPGYATADLKLNYQFSDQLRLFAGAENICGEQRDFSNASEDFRPVAGRFLYAGLTVSFGQ
ncbi:TonB-dependent receptor plug domain-containing protein [Marinobacter shengliensis]|uniref:TonB-dependent receptor plug domain-containing protein n=1 Tax=Marinobacter shengliensis TaxID=1389223 RepID=UPI001E56105C|nr:TonB-dependent receptor [Marinobacter shengliensis]MCD1631635.1 TonB-dependent receptor [Marinobacter shengliensis]